MGSLGKIYPPWGEITQHYNVMLWTLCACFLHEVEFNFYWLYVVVHQTPAGNRERLLHLEFYAAQCLYIALCRKKTEEVVRLPLMETTACRTQGSVPDDILPCHSVARWNSGDDLWCSAGWQQQCGERYFHGPRQTRPKLGYSQNVKGLSRANKFNQGLTSLRVVLISVDCSFISSLPPRQTQM